MYMYIQRHAQWNARIEVRLHVNNAKNVMQSNVISMCNDVIGLERKRVTGRMSDTNFEFNVKIPSPLLYCLSISFSLHDLVYAV